MLPFVLEDHETIFPGEVDWGALAWSKVSVTVRVPSALARQGSIRNKQNHAFTASGYQVRPFQQEEPLLGIFGLLFWRRSPPVIRIIAAGIIKSLPGIVQVIIRCSAT